MTEYIELPRQAKNLTDRRFGRLIAMGPVFKNKYNGVYWHCVCDCGNTKVVTAKSLLANTTLSCGCLGAERRLAAATKHGLNKSPIYTVWENMLRRCNNPNHPSYHHYGGRGVSVCEEWKASPLSFVEYVSQLPNYGQKGYSIDRIDTNGNYEPGNIRWASQREQLRNRRNNHVITFNGKTQCITTWGEELGIGAKVIQCRLKRGWSLERALTEPVDMRYSRSPR